MKTLTAAVASLSLMVAASTQADKTAATRKSNAVPPVLTLEDVGMSHRRLRDTRKAFLWAIYGSVPIYRHETAASLPWLL